MKISLHDTTSSILCLYAKRTEFPVSIRKTPAPKKKEYRKHNNSQNMKHQQTFNAFMTFLDVACRLGLIFP